jgi:hypothetical protein
MPLSRQRREHKAPPACALFGISVGKISGVDNRIYTETLNPKLVGVAIGGKEGTIDWKPVVDDWCLEAGP